MKKSVPITMLLTAPFVFAAQSLCLAWPVDVQGGAAIALDSGSALPVVESGASPTLTVSNALARAVGWTVSASGDDGFGRSFQVSSDATNTTLPVGGVCRIPLPATLAKGVWRLAVDVREGSSEVCRVERRFAVLDPHPVTPRLANGVFRMGIHVHCGRLPQDVSDCIVEAVTRAGAKMVRTDYGFMFADVYPTGPDAPQWGKTDRLMADFKAHGLALDAIIYGTPAWARIPELAAAKGRGEWGIPPRPGLFGKFAGEIAARYGTDIDYYEIGNELDAISRDKLPPKELLRIQREAYEAIKASAPDAKVIPCGWAGLGAHSGAMPLWGNPDLAMTMMRDGRKWFDAWPAHGHGPWEKFAYGLEHDFFPDRRANGAESVPWLCNETARSTAMGEERAAAIDVWRKILYAWSRGARDYIWYNLRAVNRDPNSSEGGYGMMTMDFEPRETYAAFSAVASIFGGMDLDRTVVSDGPKHLFLHRGEKDGAPCRVLAGWHSGFAAGCDVRVRTDAARAFFCDMMNNRREVPVRNGVAAFRWADSPAALVLEGCRKAVCEPDDLKAVAPPPPPMILGGSRDRPRDFELSDAAGHVVNVHEGLPHLQHRLWQSWKDSFTRIHLDREGVDGIRVRAGGQDDKRGDGDGLELRFENRSGQRKTVTLKPAKRIGNMDVYDAVLSRERTGLSADDLEKGFQISIRLLDDYGEGLDCWLQLGPGAEPPFVPVRFRSPSEAGAEK